VKIGVLSDTHIPSTDRFLPPRVFELFHGVDLILHAGDIVELSVLDELRAIAPVEAVAGNMDGIEVQQRLPAKKVLQLEKFRVGLIHGKFRIDEQRQRIRQEFDAVDIIVYGHSHRAFWGREQGVWFLNPGSPTDTVHAAYHSVAILTLGDEPSAEIVRI
jgi:putative phosphoesterase